VQQREAFSSLKFTSILAPMLVYMVMASQFESLLDPLIIMFSVPLGMIGVIWALFLTNTTLNVTSFMGIIMMIGIVVSNAPLARAVIGGLTISTMLTLVLIPTLYVMLEERFPRRVQAPEGEPVLQGDPA
jgi:multidrug efflux pump subunit AcrB